MYESIVKLLFLTCVCLLCIINYYLTMHLCILRIVYYVSMLKSQNKNDSTFKASAWRWHIRTIYVLFQRINRLISFAISASDLQVSVFTVIISPCGIDMRPLWFALLFCSQNYYRCISVRTSPSESKSA